MHQLVPSSTRDAGDPRNAFAALTVCHTVQGVERSGARSGARLAPSCLRPRTAVRCPAQRRKCRTGPRHRASGAAACWCGRGARRVGCRSRGPALLQPTSWCARASPDWRSTQSARRTILRFNTCAERRRQLGQASQLVSRSVGIWMRRKPKAEARARNMQYWLLIFDPKICHVRERNLRSARPDYRD